MVTKPVLLRRSYTYEVCLFGEAKQKPNHGGSTFSLGYVSPGICNAAPSLTLARSHFESWNTAEGVEPGSPEYYSKQHYSRGTKCWNGPMRSVTVRLPTPICPPHRAADTGPHQLVWTCGTENALHGVQELEKCEYQFTGTTPALCLPPDVPASTRDEL